MPPAKNLSTEAESAAPEPRGNEACGLNLASVKPPHENAPDPPPMHDAAMRLTTRTRLPPLNALRAFDATARHLTVVPYRRVPDGAPGCALQADRVERGQGGVFALGRRLHPLRHRHLARSPGAAAQPGGAVPRVQPGADQRAARRARARRPDAASAAERRRWCRMDALAARGRCARGWFSHDRDGQRAHRDRSGAARPGRGAR